MITYSLICFPPPHFALHSPYSLHAPVQFTTVGDGGGGGAGRLTHFDERQILSSSAVPQGVPSRTLTATLEDVNARLVSHLQYECFADHKKYRMISKTANKRAKRARCTVVESKLEKSRLYPSYLGHLVSVLPQCTSIHQDIRIHHSIWTILCLYSEALHTRCDSSLVHRLPHAQPTFPRSRRKRRHIVCLGQCKLRCST